VYPLGHELSDTLGHPCELFRIGWLFRCLYGWSPSSEALQHLIMGMGQDSVASMEHAQAPTDDGDILVIEVDGKARQRR